MIRIMRKTFSILFSIILLMSVVTSAFMSYRAASAELNYSFAKPDKGFAEGEIALTASIGTYWLYWADDEKALDDYKEIAKLNFEYTGTQRYNMHERCAIPENASCVIAVKSEDEPSDKTVESADAVYEIPKERLLNYKKSDKRYSFASYSDVHIDALKKSYKLDEDNWKRALEVANLRKTDFIVLSGDYIVNNVNFEGVNKTELHMYERILSESSYSNPVYEAIGNHEIRQNPTLEMPDFVEATGLDGNISKSDKAYFEKTINGDHFIFMALEKGFRPTKKQENFSDEQLNWLEGLLEKYSGDGKNIYIIEHALFYKYGAGDRVDDEPYYKYSLYDKAESTIRLKSILQKYNDAIFISGHTHIAFSYQFNFSDNDGTSAQMIHNSSVGGSRQIVGDALSSKYMPEDTEGYIVNVYNDAIIFNGTNLYKNIYDPNCCYIIRPSMYFSKNDVSTPDEAEPEKAETDEEKTYKLGDVDGDGDITVKDVSAIQRHIAKIEFLAPAQLEGADVNQDNNVNINDATRIQKYISHIINQLTAEGESKIRDDIKANLKKYYRYASYDSYQALKKAYRNSNSSDKELKRLNLNFLSYVDTSNVDKDEPLTVYFENTNDWKEVYAYNWGDNNVGKVSESPGTKLKAVKKSDLGKDIYEYTIPDKKYNKFRFTDGTNKTQDITFYSNNVCYYIYDGTKVKSVKYSK